MQVTTGNSEYMGGDCERSLPDVDGSGVTMDGLSSDVLSRSERMPGAFYIKLSFNLNRILGYLNNIKRIDFRYFPAAIRTM